MKVLVDQEEIYAFFLIEREKERERERDVGEEEDKKARERGRRKPRASLLLHTKLRTEGTLTVPVDLFHTTFIMVSPFIEGYVINVPQLPT